MNDAEGPAVKKPRLANLYLSQIRGSSSEQEDFRSSAKGTPEICGPTAFLLCPPLPSDSILSLSPAEINVLIWTQNRQAFQVFRIAQISALALSIRSSVGSRPKFSSLGCQKLYLDCDFDSPTIPKDGSHSSALFCLKATTKPSS